jgi:hypothetical protein
MAKPALEVRYSRPFYLTMLVIGLVCSVAALKLAIAPPNAPGSDLPMARPTVLWILLGGLLLTMGAYMWRALKRLTTPAPAILVRHEGLILNIGEPRLFRWDEIVSVTMGRYHLRNRLEIAVEPQRFAELNMPRLFSDDNFMAVRQKPDTIGLTGQGLDRSLFEIMDAIRARRANLVRR